VISLKKVADVDTLITRAKEAVKTVKPEDSAQADLYVKYLERIKSKPQFLETEIERLKKLVSGGSITPIKRDEFSKRLNVLLSFSTPEPEPVPAPLEEELEDDSDDADDADDADDDEDGEDVEDDDDDDDVEGEEKEPVHDDL